MFDVPLNPAECRRVLFLLWGCDQTLGVSQVRSHTRESVNAVTVGTDQSLFLVAIDQNTPPPTLSSASHSVELLAVHLLALDESQTCSPTH